MSQTLPSNTVLSVTVISIVSLVPSPLRFPVVITSVGMPRKPVIVFLVPCPLEASSAWLNRPTDILERSAITVTISQLIMETPMLTMSSTANTLL